MPLMGLSSVLANRVAVMAGIIRKGKHWIIKSVILPLLNSRGYEIRRKLTRENVHMIAEGEVISFNYCGINYRMFVNNAHDVIQRCYINGELYESDELQIIAREFRVGGAFLDIGANVGNHAIFAAKALGASRVFAFEPASPQRDILAINVVLNDLAETVMVQRVGLSNAASIQRFEIVDPDNIGGTRISNSAGGETVTMVRGDDILGDVQIDFIKIDVEGHEMLVLEGMEELITKNRPPIFVEVDNENRQLFSKWLDAHEYRVADSFKRYQTSKNYMVTPT